MTTPSGQISLNDVNVELGIAGTTLIEMNQANVRTLAGVGGSGTPISMQDLQNKSNRVVYNIILSGNTTNYTLNTSKVPGYSSGKTDATLTINSGVTVYSTSTGSYGLTVDTSWSPGDTVAIVNNGTILGAGGAGGFGHRYAASAPLPGSPGGPALLVQRAITMNNINRIAGGGGGGGGGGSSGGKTFPNGAGGGGGVGNGPGGPGGNTNAPPGPAGNPGTLTNGGDGVNGDGIMSGFGGGYGSAGTAGQQGVSNNRGQGGGAGACIAGNSNITYTNTGTRNGSIS